MQIWQRSLWALLCTISAQAWCLPSEPQSQPQFSLVDIEGLDSLGGFFAIAQDANGFLWFGGKNGLQRFDGYRTVTYRHDPKNPASLASNDISDILVDKQGRLWVAMLSGGGLDRYDFASDQFIHFQHRPDDPFSISDNDVYALAEDQSGDLWLATHGGGLNRLEVSSGRFYGYTDQINAAQAEGVRDLKFDRSGTLWAATRKDGLYSLNFVSNEFRHYVHVAEEPTSLSDNQLYRLYLDQYDNVWVGTLAGGVNRFDRKKGEFTRFTHRAEDPNSLGEGMVWDIAEDSYGSLWVATGNGALNRFNKWQNQFDRFYPDEYAPNALKGTVIRMLSDGAGDFWLGTYDSRLHRMTERGPQFEILRHSPSNPNSLLSSRISALTADALGALWVASDEGLSYYQPNDNLFSHYRHTDGDRSSLPAAPIRAMTVGDDMRLWIGTNGEGLWLKSPNSHNFEPYQSDDQYPFQGDRIWALRFTSDKRLWVGTQKKGLCQIGRAGEFMGCYGYDKSDPASLPNDFVWHMIEGQHGRLWVATQSGLAVMDLSNPGDFKHYTPDNSSLSNSAVHALAEDAEGNIWIGTASGLNRLNPNNDHIDSYQVTDGLLDDYISAIVIDGSGYVWLTTLRGLARYSPQQKIFQNYDKRHGVASNTALRHHAALRLPSDELVFGSADGLTLINPQLIRPNITVPPVVLTALHVNNNQVKIGSKILPIAINALSTLVLTQRQNSFAIEFAALNYLLPEQNRYQYKLVGFDDDWHTSSADKRLATYTNLDSGHYTFLVMGANNEGLWNEIPKQLNIEIQPTWWRTWVAYLVYLALLALLLYVIWQGQKRRLESAEMLATRLHEVDQFKDQFLANISHRLRNPLNAIIGLAENMMDGGAGELSSVALQQLQIIDDNGQKLVRMVDDILDFSELNRDEIVLHCRMLDVQSIAERSVDWFTKKAEAKDLKLYYNLQNELPMIWADPNRVQQMLFYLLDNAIKFTAHGYIELTLSSNRQWVTIKVADTGIGISSQHLDAVFRGFEQIKNNHGIKHSGLGIGLSRVKHLVHLHSGTIDVESKPQKGSVFTIQLPAHAEHLS